MARYWWRARRAATAAPPPWTAAEEAELRNAMACGLDCTFWPVVLPGRRFGDIANKRLQLVEAGAKRTRPI